MHAAFDCARFKTLASLPLIALAEELSACTYLSEEATLAVSFARRRIKYDLRNTADLRFFTSPTHVSCSELINELKTSSIKSEKTLYLELLLMNFARKLCSLRLRSD